MVNAPEFVCSRSSSFSDRYPALITKCSITETREKKGRVWRRAKTSRRRSGRRLREKCKVRWRISGERVGG